MLRWIHPKVGMVPPKDFIPLLEQTGLIMPVGEWVIEQACQQWTEWKQQQLIPEDALMTINVSTCQFSSQQLLECICRTSSKLKMPANTLALEISEELINTNNQRISQTFELLNKAGVDIIMDDFGLGSTSVHSLSKYKLSAIKLEKPLLASLTKEKDSTSLRAFSNLAHSLNVTMIAEGVDDTNLLPTLARAGIDSYQGYSLSPAVGADDFESFIRTQHKNEEKVNYF